MTPRFPDRPSAHKKGLALSRALRAAFTTVALVGSVSLPLGAQTSTTAMVYGLKGPSGVGMVRLFGTPPSGGGVSFKVEALASPDLVVGKLATREAVAGILPPNLAAKVAAGGRTIQVAAVVGSGMLSLITADPAVTSIADLRGSRVEVAGQGASPDWVFRRILARYKMEPGKDIDLGYSLAYPEIAQSLIAGKVNHALLPEPFATMALRGKPALRTVGSIQDEWAKAGGSSDYPMTVLVVDKDFADRNPAAMVALLTAWKDSVDWVTSHPAEAGLLSEQAGLGLKADIVAAAIPRSNYTFIPAAKARPSLEALLGAFLEYSPASIGGTLPPASFYYGN